MRGRLGMASDVDPVLLVVAEVVDVGYFIAYINDVLMKVL